MERCSPVETRNNLAIAKNYASIGLDFVCVPVINQESKKHLQRMAVSALESLAVQSEKDDRDSSNA